MTLTLRWIGQWADAVHPDRPVPQDHVDPHWPEVAMADIAHHLDQGFIVGWPLDGHRKCLICGANVTRGPIQTDCHYVWRGELAHYVKEHSVRLPASFEDHVARFYRQFEDAEEDCQWWDAQPYSSAVAEDALN